MNEYDPELYQEARERRFAQIRARKLRKQACPICGLHLCICQTSLKDY